MESAPLAAAKETRGCRASRSARQHDNRPGAGAWVLDNLISNAVKFSPPGAHTTVRDRKTAIGLAGEHHRSRAESRPRNGRCYFRNLAGYPRNQQAEKAWVGVDHLRQLIVEARSCGRGFTGRERGATFWFGCAD